MWVVDLDYERVARNVRVTQHFADEHDEQVKTASRGLAIRAGKSVSPFIAVDLAGAAPSAVVRGAVQ